MTERLPHVSGRRLVKALTRLGFVFVSQRGSHVKLVRGHGAAKEIIVVPDHKVVKKGILHGILKKIHLMAEELKKLL